MEDGKGGARGNLARICRLDGGGEGLRIRCAFFLSFFLAQVACTVLYILISLFFIAMIHFTLSSTSNTRSLVVILVHKRVNRDCILFYCFRGYDCHAKITPPHPRTEILPTPRASEVYKLT